MQHVVDHAFVAIGIENSLHCDGLALDLIVKKDGEILWTTPGYEELGEYWKTLDPLCCWGGDFEHEDGGHISITHGGRR